MTVSNQDETGEDPANRPVPDAASEQQTPSEPSKAPAKPTLRLAAITIAMAIAMTAIAQFCAPYFDHQNANLIGLTCLVIATLYLLFSLHRLARWEGHPWLVPTSAVALSVLLAAMFQFEGFSGEMLPRFRFRFANEKQHELKSVPAMNSDGQQPEGQIAEPPVMSAVEESNESPQFLGPNRNGVYPSRSFAIPTSPAEAKVLWDHGIGEGWSSFAVSGPYAITMEQREREECLTCYRLSDGELIWIHKHAGFHDNPLGGIGPRSTPTIDNDKVYATSATGFLSCVNLADGEIVWTTVLLELAGWNQATFETAAPWGYAGSPLLVDGLCVVPLGGPVGGTSSASLIALDAVTGDFVWKSGDDQLSYASPTLVTLDGQRQIVSVNEKTVSGHNISDGETLWQFDWPGSTNTGANCSSAVPVGDDRLLVGKGYGGGSALVEIKREETSWKTNDIWRSNRVLKTKFNHTCVDGNVGYAISNGSLQAVNLEDATAYWTQPRRNRAGQGQVVLAGDVLVMQDEEGDVVLVDANKDDYNERLRIPALESKTWNIPTVAGRYVLVRNDRQAICFELPEK